MLANSNARPLDFVILLKKVKDIVLESLTFKCVTQSESVSFQRNW